MHGIINAQRYCVGHSIGGMSILDMISTDNFGGKFESILLNTVLSQAIKARRRRRKLSFKTLDYPIKKHKKSF